MDQNKAKIHKKDLGFDVPEGYFLTSKNDILSKVSAAKKPKIISIFKQKIVWFAAAGIALIFALTVFKQQTIPSIKNIPTIVSDTLNSTKNLDLAFNSFIEDEVLVSSLFVSDTQIDSYLNNAFIEEVVADEYLDDFIVDQLIDEELF